MLINWSYQYGDINYGKATGGWTTVTRFNNKIITSRALIVKLLCYADDASSIVYAEYIRRRNDSVSYCTILSSISISGMYSKYGGMERSVLWYG